MGIDIGEEFRHQKFLEGVVLRSSHALTFDVSALGPGHRGRIWNAYRGWPNELGVLSIPKCPGKGGEIDLKASPWQAAVDPRTTPTTEIFDTWAVAYEQALERAQAERDKALSQEE